MPRGRGGVARYHRRPSLLQQHSSTSQHGPGEPSDSGVVSGTSTGQTEEPAGVLEDPTAEDDAGGGRQAKPGGGGRRKAGSARLGFQYPDVFGRRRTRGGSMAGAGRRRAITSGRINFRRQTAQAQGDDVTSNDTGNQPEVSFNIQNSSLYTGSPNSCTLLKS